MLDRSLKRWEASLLFGLLAALFWGCWMTEEQQLLADRVIRFHVVAHSNEPQDQQLKLQVRDQVLAAAQSFYPAQGSRQEALEALESNLAHLEQVGQTVVQAQGFPYSVTARLEECWFPTKEYQGFSLPSGEYTALNIVIGDGAGDNWWCVAFPPLCVGAASAPIQEAAQAGLFTEDQIALVTELDQGYILKFKSMELLGNVKHMLERFLSFLTP